jgi:hypothetical protein
MNHPEGQAVIANIDMAVIKHYFSYETFKKKIMTRFNRTRIVGTALIISGLLVLLLGYGKNDPIVKVSVEIDNVVENIAERIKIESDRLINDRPDEDIREELNEAAEYAGEMV